VQALLRHFLPKNGFIFGIQENSSSSNSPSIQFTQDEWLFEIKFLRFWFDFAFFDDNSSAYHTENSSEGEILTKEFVLFVCPL